MAKTVNQYTKNYQNERIFLLACIEYPIWLTTLLNNHLSLRHNHFLK